MNDRDNALESHTGIDVCRGKWAKSAIAIRIKLNENQVPNFDATRVIHVHERTFGISQRREIDVDFGARSARTCVAHHPEIVGFVAVYNMDIGIEPGFLEDGFPNVIRDLIEIRRIPFAWLINRCVETLWRKLPAFCEKLPSPFDRFCFEVVSKRPVAQHFEERVVIRVVADIVEIVVLSAGTNAFLRVSSARWIVGSGLGSQEIRDELVHARIGEHQVRRGGHDRRRRHDGVQFFFEEIEEGLSDFAGG